MEDTMKDAFSTTLKSLHWMTADSQTAALHKLANMMDLIGYNSKVKPKLLAQCVTVKVSKMCFAKLCLILRN